MSRPYKPRILQTTGTLAKLLGRSENAVRELYRRGRLEDGDASDWPALLSLVRYGLEKGLVTPEQVLPEVGTAGGTAPTPWSEDE